MRPLVENGPAAQTNEELVCWLHEEELAMEKACQGQDVATLEVTVELARHLMQQQMEGLEGPNKQVGECFMGARVSQLPEAETSQPPMAEVSQLPLRVSR